LAVLAAFCVSGAQASSAANATPERAEMADRAADMVGVNTHISYRGSVYDTRWAGIVMPRLLELGVRHIRDSPAGPVDYGVKGRFVDLAKRGVRTLMANGSDADKDYVKSVNALGGMRVVEAVEPPNEYDLTGAGWQTRLRDRMLRMYAAYRADPATQGILVLGPSFANGRDSAQSLAGVFPEAGGYMDHGNLHNYSGLHPASPYGGGWHISLPDSLERYRSLSGNKSSWVTENGYKMSGSNPPYFPAVTQRAAAKYMPRQFLMHLQHGVPRYYIYQLINDKEDFGLLDSSGYPRLQYTSVKNFINTFKDPGVDFTTGTLSYSLTGDMNNIRRALFQKRSGCFYLTLWQEVESSSGHLTTDSTIRDIEPAARNLTLNLATRITRARIHRPSFSMEAVGTHSNAGGIASLTLSVPDHITVVELSAQETAC
jgi:hypothetical protein